MVKKINEVISKLRTYLQNDGGDMELVSYDKKTGVIIIKVLGACIGCEYFDDTFNDNIKQTIMLELPKIKNVLFI
ncbi:MAG: hypothetical protein Ta2E_06590 [Mycoplasmoidaceae bacterium]|nr:MAG: hypothetical protein Ta2E_06590 [Mycoplasmoidaceae bacterium]